jgi:Tol biopolymer transport system component
MSAFSALSIIFALMMFATPTSGAEGKAIADGVSTKGRVFAWSPDGTKVAYVSGTSGVSGVSGVYGGLFVFNTLEKSASRIFAFKPFYINWLDDGRLATLYFEGNNTMLAMVSADGRNIQRALMPDGTRALYEHPLGGGLLIAQDRLQKTNTSIEVSHRLSIFMPNGNIREIFSTGHVYAGSSGITPAQVGWMPSGPSPLDARMPLLERIEPNDRNSYTKLSLIDPITGGSEEIYRVTSETLPKTGAWSPRGDRLAISGGEMQLFMLGLDGSLKAVEDSLKGSHPAWSPAGSQLNFGDTVIDSDGNNFLKLQGAGEIVKSRWRPDGTGLLTLNSNGFLYLFSGIVKPSALKEDKAHDREAFDKLILLVELYLEGLINKIDYNTRVSKIRQGADR